MAIFGCKVPGVCGVPIFFFVFQGLSCNDVLRGGQDDEEEKSYRRQETSGKGISRIGDAWQMHIWTCTEYDAG